MYEASFHYVTCIFTYYVLILYAAERRVSMSTHIDHKCSVLCTLLFGEGNVDQFHYDFVSSRRVQEMLLALKDEKCELAQAIAYGTEIPKLGKCFDTLLAEVQQEHSFRGT